MKKILTALVAAVFTVTALSAQQTIKSYKVEAFDMVVLSGNLATQLIPSESNAIEVELHDADIKRFKWAVSDGTMSVSLSALQSGSGRADVKIYYVEALKDITVSGGELSTPSPVKSPILKVAVKGGAKLNAKLESLDLDVSVSGNSAAQAGGFAKYLTLHAGEKSKADFRELSAVSAVVDASIGAEVYVNTSERLITNAKTGSKIYYKGRPAIVKDVTSKMNAGITGSSVINID